VQGIIWTQTAYAKLVTLPVKPVLPLLYATLAYLLTQFLIFLLIQDDANAMMGTILIKQPV
jgi:hypothetical protein